MGHRASDFGESAAFAPGTRIGDFVLGEELGRGAFGIVVVARQVSLQREVALKLLRTDGTLTANRLLRFKTEGIAAARLDDARIVKVFAVGEEGGVAWIAMEWVRGHSVAQELAMWRESSHGLGTKPRLAPPRDAAAIGALVRFVADAARGLETAHRAGVLHRDVKPSNLLIDPAGHPRIIDFGLARLLEEPGVTATGDVAGTPYYMSPEQVRAVRQGIDHRTDVFSLGVVLYELLTQQRPFEGATSQQVFHSIATRTPESPRTHNRLVTPALALICGKAMEKDARHRFASAGEFADELERFAQGERIKTVPMSLPVRAARFCRRHPMATVTATVALIAGAGGAALAMPRARTATLVCETAQLAGARASLRAIEPLRWELGAARDLGTVPLRATLPLGHYRLVLARDGTFAELTRELAVANEVITVGPHVRLVPAAQANEGMVEVAAGTFAFGTKLQDQFPERQPQQVDLPVFRIDACEVSNADYRAFLLATGRRAPPIWPQDWQTTWPVAWDALPVGAVNQEEAQAFAEWAGKRLPTEKEWEKAARGIEGRPYPWGGSLDAGAADDTKARARVGVRNRATGDWQKRAADYSAGVVPVGDLSEGGSPFGLFDTVGNVSEWTETVGAQVLGGAATVVAGFRIVRGAAWDDGESYWPVFHTQMASATGYMEFMGFRCAKSVLP